MKNTNKQCQQKEEAFLCLFPKIYNLRYFEPAMVHEKSRCFLGEKISILKGGGRGNNCFRPNYRPLFSSTVSNHSWLLVLICPKKKKNLFKAQEKLKKEVNLYPERAKPIVRSLWTVLPFSMHKYEALHSGIVSLKLKNPNLQAN